MYRTTTALTLAMLGLLITSHAYAGSATITPGNPHELNLTFNTDFEASEEEMAAWKKVVEQGSSALLDATEGQMKIGKVTAYNNCAGMVPRSDIVILENKTGASFSAMMYTDKHDAGHRTLGARIKIHKNGYKQNRPGLSLAHEIGHYIFFVHDEYKGEDFWRYQDEVADLPYMPDGGYFCTGPDGEGTASIMNTNAVHRKSEFCTASADGWGTAHHDGHIIEYCEDDRPLALVRLNNQQRYRKMSAWEYIVWRSPKQLGITMNYPGSEPQPRAGSTAIEWEERACDDTLMLVIDRSGSMDGGGLAMAKIAAWNVIEAIPDGDKVGIVAFSTFAGSVFPITVVDDDVRNQAKLAVAGLVAGGETNIGGALIRAYNELTTDEVTGKQEIQLLSDGEHTTGPEPASVIGPIREAGIIVNGVGMGSANMATFNELALATGGEAQYVATPNGLPKVMVQQALRSQGYQVIRSDSGEVAPGGSVTHEVLVDELSPEVVFSMSTIGTGTALQLRDPDGHDVALTDPGVQLLYETGGTAIRVNDPKPGIWKLDVTHPDTALFTVGFTTEVFGRSSKIDLTTALSTPLALYPHPVQIRAHVLGDGNLVAGASVHAELRDLFGNVQTIEMFDDGQTGHGDEFAGDGVYGASFAAYPANGIFSVVVRADSEGGVAASREPHKHGEPVDEGAPPRRAPHFHRERSMFLAVLGVPNTAESNTLALKGSDSHQRGAVSLEGKVPNMPMLSLTARTGKGEYVSVSSLKLRDVGDGDMANVHGARLWIDGDKDGLPDYQGEYTTAIGSTTPDGRELTFDALLLPPDSEVDLLVSYDVVAPHAAGDDHAGVVAPPRGQDPWRWLALLGLTLLAAAIVLRLAGQRVRRRLSRGALTIGAACLTLSACSDDESTAPAGSPEPTSVVVNAYQLELVVDETSAVGLTSGEAVSVDAKAVQGPLLEVSP